MPLPNFGGGPQPRNTLEGPGAPAIPDPTPRPAKRRKLSHDADIREHKTNSVSPSASQSSLSFVGPMEGFRMGIPELRTLDRSAGTEKRRVRRSRAEVPHGKSPGMPQARRNQDQGELPSDPITSDLPEELRAGEPGKPVRKLGFQDTQSTSLVELQKSHNRRTKDMQNRKDGDTEDRKPTYRGGLSPANGYIDESSIDELQQDQHAPRGRRGASSNKQSSTREEFTSQDPALASAKATIGSGLRVAEATTFAHGYELGKDRPAECFLQVRDRCGCLVPVDEQGLPLEELGWMSIDLQFCISIARSKSPCSIVEVFRRNAPGGNRRGDNKLVVSFTSAESVQSLDEWANRILGKNSVITVKDTDKLRAILNKTKEERSDPPPARVPHDTPWRDGHDGVTAQRFIIPASSVSDYSAPSEMQVRGESIRSRMQPTVAADGSRGVPMRVEAGVGADRTVLFGVDATRRSTRNTRRPIPDPQEPAQLPDGWTLQHPDWATEHQWEGSLLWQRERVDQEDISRLDEGGFLNDNLVMFYLRWLYAELQARDPETAARIYVHNSHFYERLKPSRPGARHVNYDAVKSWTAKVDIFSFDYIVVPVCENVHWYLAIICNPSKLLPVAKGELVEMVEVDLTSHTSSANHVTEPLRRLSLEDMRKPDEDHSRGGAEKDIADLDSRATVPSPPVRSPFFGTEDTRKRRSGALSRQYDPAMPRIITLDSMDQSHSQTCVHLRDYLVEEIKARKHIDIDSPGALGMTAKGIPYQPNFWDCGIYLLGYLDAFFKNPDGFIAGMLQREPVPMDIRPSALRVKIRETVFEKMAQQKGLKKVSKKAKAKKTRTLVDEPQPPAVNHESQHSEAAAPKEAAKKVIDRSPFRREATPYPVRPGSESHSLEDEPEERGLDAHREKEPALQQPGRVSEGQDLKTIQQPQNGHADGPGLPHLQRTETPDRRLSRDTATAEARSSSTVTVRALVDLENEIPSSGTRAKPDSPPTVEIVDDDDVDHVAPRNRAKAERNAKGAVDYPRTRPPPLARPKQPQHVDLTD